MSILTKLKGFFVGTPKNRVPDNKRGEFTRKISPGEGVGFSLGFKDAEEKDVYAVFNDTSKKGVPISYNKDSGLVYFDKEGKIPSSNEAEERIAAGYKPAIRKTGEIEWKTDKKDSRGYLIKEVYPQQFRAEITALAKGKSLESGHEVLEEIVSKVERDFGQGATLSILEKELKQLDKLSDKLTKEYLDKNKSVFRIKSHEGVFYSANREEVDVLRKRVNQKREAIYAEIEKNKRVKEENRKNNSKVCLEIETIRSKKYQSKALNELIKERNAAYEKEYRESYESRLNALVQKKRSEASMLRRVFPRGEATMREEAEKELAKEKEIKLTEIENSARGDTKEARKAIRQKAIDLFEAEKAAEELASAHYSSPRAQEAATPNVGRDTQAELARAANEAIEKAKREAGAVKGAE